MSEYQFIAFQAVDRPLTDKELQFAESQSSRAEITRWSFTNEYHYGDFRGDAEKLLQHGYDVHLHYANFGLRRVMMRLPVGLPFPQSLWSQYIDGERLAWKRDKKGAGGILQISPFIESGDLETIWEPEAYVDDLVQVRNELIAGDLRALYTAWLCGTQDSYFDPREEVEPPVPAGIGQASDSCQNLLDFYDVEPLMLVAAGEAALPCPENADPEAAVRQWIQDVPDEEARDLLGRFLLGDVATAKAEAMKKIREASNVPSWPVSPGRRTLEQLQEQAQRLRAEVNAREKAKKEAAARREAKRKEQERQERMKLMAKQPETWLEEADKLVADRGTANYKAAADILADLGEALGGEEGMELARQHAAELANSYPTLTHLKSSLRKRGLWP